MKENKRNIKILDCTLRDGGHVNDAEFGYETIRNITQGLSKSNIDVIELGFLKNGCYSINQSSYNDVTEIYPTLPENVDENYSVMIRPDWYDISQLSECSGKIDIIRFAFYYKDFELLKKYCGIVKKKGYRVICNPVNVMGYTNNELVEMVKRVNDLLPEQFTIVDTYGSMNISDLNRIYSLVENKLDSEVSIGLHLHENMSLSYGLAQKFLEIREPSRNVMIDSSLLGMGRAPGNLCTEIIASHLNSTIGAKYDLASIYDLIGKYIEPIKAKTPWGYSPAYYMTACMNMHRSYAEHLLKEGDIPLFDIYEMLKKIDPAERKEFNKVYIDDMVKNYRCAERRKN